jgi:hypothetical protein
MIPFHKICPAVAACETRSVTVGPGRGLPADEYAFIEFYCEDRACDCRRAFFQVLSRRLETTVASINFGWEPERFYRKKYPFDPDAPRNITRGCLDPLNQQSEHAAELLKLFQRVVVDAPYRLWLKRHYELFKRSLEQTQQGSPGQA